MEGRALSRVVFTRLGAGSKVSERMKAAPRLAPLPLSLSPCPVHLCDQGMPATETERGEKGGIVEEYAQSISEGTPETSMAAAGKGKASAVEVVDDDSGHESNDDEQEDDEYAIEKILKHRMAKDVSTKREACLWSVHVENELILAGGREPPSTSFDGRATRAQTIPGNQK